MFVRKTPRNQNYGRRIFKHRKFPCVFDGIHLRDFDMRNRYETTGGTTHPGRRMSAQSKTACGGKFPPALSARGCRFAFRLRERCNYPAAGAWRELFSDLSGAGTGGVLEEIVMSIFHCQAKAISRATGRSVTAETERSFSKAKEAHCIF